VSLKQHDKCEVIGSRVNGLTARLAVQLGRPSA
jgi:hypothetical protein